MKNKSIFLIITLLVMLSIISCKKTYQCQDINGSAIGQVEARNIEKAKDMCPMNSKVILSE
jgi:hypothetical protein